MKKFALIVAGGSGNRMNGNVPKQFLNLLGKPVLMHTMETFFRYDPGIIFIVVLPKAWIRYWMDLCRNHNFELQHQLISGGVIRFQSVKNGLQQISDDGIVFIHDGVRPLVSIRTIQNCFELAAIKGNALPVIPVSESLRELNSDGNNAVDRSKYYLVQTPQTFQVELIQKAYNQSVSDDYTDDATVLESMGEIINLTEGNRENIKITYTEDMLFAEAILSHQ